MTVYAKKTLVTDLRFSNRAVSIISQDGVDVIPVPNNQVICNGCNSNIAETEVVDDETPTGYLIYLGKRELKADEPYDIYCYRCARAYFNKAVYV